MPQFPRPPKTPFVLAPALPGPYSAFFSSASGALPPEILRSMSFWSSSLDAVFAFSRSAMRAS